MMRVLGTIAAIILALGCSGTREAYKAAENVEDYAFVVTQHYAALVHEAANLKDAGALPANVLSALQAADARTKPAVLKLGDLAQAYATVKSAENEQALQAAVNDAIVLVAEFARLLRSSGGTSAIEPPRLQEGFAWIQ